MNRHVVFEFCLSSTFILYPIIVYAFHRHLLYMLVVIVAWVGSRVLAFASDSISDGQRNDEAKPLVGVSAFEFSLTLLIG